MKKRRNIFLKILFLIVLFFYQGINAQANIDTHRYYIEISNETGNSESRLTPYDNSSDEDQIDLSPVSDISGHPECQKYGFITLPLLNILFVSIWQPPKVF